MKRMLVLGALALAAVLVAPSGALAGDTICPPNIVGGVHDNIVVPPGQTCTISRATVRGNIKALEDSRLFVDQSQVGGNIEGDKASAVHANNMFNIPFIVRGNIHIIEAHDPVFASAVVFNTVLTHGNIQVEKGRFPYGDWIIEKNHIQRGNIKIEENGSIFKSNVGSISVGNRVAQNLQVFKNFGPGAKTVQNNTVGENLQCKENTAPFLGGPNTAGKAEDQCF